MRLIVSVDALREPLTGIGRYTWELVRRLTDCKDFKQLRFYRNSQWVAKPALLLSGAPGLDRGDQLKLPGQFSLPRIPRWARDVYWETTCRFNVFHGPNYFLPACARNGVITVHDLSVFLYPESHPIQRVREFEKYFQASLGRARQLITDSEAVRSELISAFNWPADRVTAISLGVGSEYKPREVKDLVVPLADLGLTPEGYTLCVATIEPRKRIDALISAYGRLPTSIRSRWPLVLAGGNGWKSEDLHLAIGNAQAQGWLKYVGYVPQDHLPILYAGARAFAYPSVYEGFGLPVAEAMASGVPVVTSDRSCLPEVTAGAGLLADPDNIPAWSSALERALTDEIWRATASQLGLDVATRYTWDDCLLRTMAVYRSASK